MQAFPAGVSIITIFWAVGQWSRLFPGLLFVPMTDIFSATGTQITIPMDEYDHVSLFVFICGCFHVFSVIYVPTTLKMSIIGMDETSADKHRQSRQRPKSPENCVLISVHLWVS